MAGPRTRPPRRHLLEELGPGLLGTGDVMALVGYCWTMCWYAAQGGNSELAVYYLNRVRGLLRRLGGFKPKYRKQVADYDRDHLEPVFRALQGGDRRAFASAFQAAVDRANLYHVETGHPYIVWRLPDGPPQSGLELGPVS